MSNNNISIGSQAEAYVYYRLLSWGYDAHFASGIGASFDLFVRVDSKIVTIQVKGTSFSERTRPNAEQSFSFYTCKGSGKKTKYQRQDWDILALVALPYERALFDIAIPGKRKRVQAKKFNLDKERQTWERSIERILEDS